MIQFEVLKKFSGGKSKEELFLVHDKKHKKRVLKLSDNKKRLLSEINLSIRAKNLFTDKDNPIVDIYDYGTLEYNGTIHYYYLMQYLGENYLELDDVIEIICMNRPDNVFDIKKILLNIFEVLKTFKLANFSHCDLHTKNIFIHKKNQSIKIIDFGLASEKECVKKRELSKSILDSYKKCSKHRDKFFKRKRKEISLFANLLKGELGKLEIDSDLSMFITILSIFYADKTILNELQKISSAIHKTSSIKERQLLLEQFKDKLDKLNL